MKPLVTIAIALYNNEPQIQRCIQSVVDQTYENLEIIIMNDGSTDKSKEKAIGFEDERIVVIDKKNEGLSSARQMALDMAKGEYICFIDGDDYLLIDFVEKMEARMERDLSDICICSTLFIDENGQTIKSGTNYFKAKEFEKPIKGGENNQIRWLFLSDSWNKMYRLSFLKSSRVKFSMPKGLNGTDRAFNMKLYVHEPIYSSISATCYVHVIYKQSAVHRKHKDLLMSYMTIIEQIEEECIQIGKQEEFYSYLNRHYYLFLRSAFQDIYNETSGIFAIRKQFDDIYLRHKKFVEKHSVLAHPLMLGTKSHVLFLRLFCHFKAMLPAYFFSRKAMIK